MQIILQSTALFGSWTFIPSHHLLIDAGDGVAQALGRRVSGIRTVLITHAHADHVSGLYALVRARLRNPEAEPLDVYVPDPLPDRILALMKFLAHDRTDRGVRFFPLKAYDNIPMQLGKQELEIRPFLVNHGKARAFGYTLFEKRTRLAARLAGATPEAIISARRVGIDVSEKYDHALLTHTGDTLPVDPALFSSPDVLIHDATFLREEDRDEADADHSSLFEAVHAFEQSGAKVLIGMHLSARYMGEDISTYGSGKVHLAPPGKISTYDTRDLLYYAQPR